MNGFDPEALTLSLGSLAPLHLAAFAAATSERLIPNYRQFWAEESWGNPELLRQNLGVAWSWIHEGAGDPDAVEKAYNVSLDLAQEPGEFASDFTSAALDAANGVATTLRLLLAQSHAERIECCVECATYATDTVDMYIRTVDDIDAHSPDLEERIRRHPLWERELAVQSRHVELLAGQPELSSEFLFLLRTKRSNLDIEY
jgi:uncharacterized protein YjaG (DUF416 family)